MGVLEGKDVGGDLSLLGQHEDGKHAFAPNADAVAFRGAFTVTRTHKGVQDALYVAYVIRQDIFAAQLVGHGGPTNDGLIPVIAAVDRIV